MADDRNNRSSTGRDRRGRFTKGNPGRPPGARHKSTLAVQALLDGEAEALTRAAIERALEGDVAALRLCLERLAPPRRDAPVAVDLPEVTGAADLVKASGAILAAVADGCLTPSEAKEIAGILATHARAIEIQDLEARIAALEAKEGKP